MSKQEKKTKGIGSKEMLILTYVFVFIFLALIIYLIYYEAVTSQDVINSPYNRRRQELLAEKVVRGKIETSDGKVLAETLVDEEGKETRNYPYENMFSHVVGYSMNGGSGLEAYNNVRLLTSNVFFGKQFMNNVDGVKNIGDNIITTLDYDVQRAAYKALGSNQGAVVAIEPETGKVLAMVSKPDYDPNDIEEMWEDLVKADSDNSVLVNRATQGQYPPGSTFKIFTLLEYIRENPNVDETYSYKCKGSHSNEQGDTINCYRGTVHGKLNLKESFTNSCNSSFVNIGHEVERDELVGLCEDFGFNSSFDIGINSKKSQITLNKKTTDYKLMQTVIGQGDTLVTPLQMAVVAATIANDGVMMEPYLVDYIENADGGTIKTYSPDEIGEPISEEECKTLQEYMVETAKSGTAKSLAGQSYTAAGKTGSAEYGTTKGQSHAWFVGYAQKDGKNIAISVIVEGAGSGSKQAVPVAKKVFNAYFKQ